ncbi:MAG: sensor histidine kinase [Alphaproteobacteria bacterium]
MAVLTMVVFGLLAVVLLGFIYYATIDLIDRETNNVIEAESKGLVEQYSLFGLRGVAAVIRHRSENLKEPGAIYLLANENFEPMIGNLIPWPANAENEPLFPPKESEWIHFSVSRGEGEEKVTRQMRARVINLSPGYHLLVGRDVGERERFREVMRAALTWSVVITLMLAFLGGLLLSRQMLRRVDTIARTSRQIIDGDLTKRVKVRGTGDEFDRLSTNLNEMLDQIERLLVGMRAVTDSVAHDLGAPLTRLKSRIEMTLRGEQNLEAYRAALQNAIKETDHIRSTFDALIDIARAEASVANFEMKPLDLAELAAELLELYEPVANERKLHLESTIPPSASILANRQTLAQALTNLLDNAIKYTPTGGVVRLELMADTKRVYFTLKDSGPGIPAADRERVLQRFVRLEKAAEIPGTGLGLSLVAAVAKLHRATLELGDNQPGLKVTLTLREFTGRPSEPISRPHGRSEKGSRSLGPGNLRGPGSIGGLNMGRLGTAPMRKDLLWRMF